MSGRTGDELKTFLILKLHSLLYRLLPEDLRTQLVVLGMTLMPLQTQLVVLGTILVPLQTQLVVLRTQLVLLQTTD